MAAAMQVADQADAATSRTWRRSANWRLAKVWTGARSWQKAVHRVAADGITPEQAVDEAIARIKEILSE